MLHHIYLLWLYQISLICFGRNLINFQRKVRVCLLSRKFSLTGEAYFEQHSILCSRAVQYGIFFFIENWLSYWLAFPKFFLSNYEQQSKIAITWVLTLFRSFSWEKVTDQRHPRLLVLVSVQEYWSDPLLLLKTHISYAPEFLQDLIVLTSQWLKQEFLTCLFSYREQLIRIL